MMLRFHPEALDEFDAAVAWHEQERDGRGTMLLRNVVKRVAQAARFPRSGAPVAGFDAHHDVRQFVLRRLPYVVITASIMGERMVVAVAHTSKRPGYWRSRFT